jgi:hypothetical protein
MGLWAVKMQAVLWLEMLDCTMYYVIQSPSFMSFSDLTT